MHYFLQSSPTVPVWLAVLLAIIAASGTWLAVFINRKRSSSVRAEEHKLDAETIRLGVQSVGDLYDQLRTTRDEMTEIVHESTAKARELRDLHAKQIEFLQAQVDLKTEEAHDAREKEQRARDRFHAANHEIERCIFRIRDYEELLRTCDPKIEFDPFDFSSYKDLLEGRFKDGPTI